MDLMKLKQYAAEGLIVEAVMSVGDRVQAKPGRFDNYLTKHNLLAVFVHGGRWKAGPG